MEHTYLGDSVVVLVAITKLGRGKPLVIETVANEETGLTITRVSVGIDPNANRAQVYGPVTALYVTYNAMWQGMWQDIKSAGVRSGENRMDCQELNLWLASQQVLCVSCTLECVFFVCENACVCVCECVPGSACLFVVEYFP